MRIGKLSRAFTANIGIKIVSLMFAIFFWLYVTAQIGERQTFSVPLELANVPESLAVVQGVPKEIAISVRSTRGELLKLRLMSNVRAIVDVSGARGGRVIVPLSTGILSLPASFKPEDVSIESPKSLTLEFERIVSISVPVAPVMRGAVSKDMILVGKPTVTPDRVLLRGPANAVNGITSVETVPIELREKRGSFSREVSIRTGRGWTTVPARVLVEFEIARRAVRTIEGISLTLLHEEEGLEVEYSPRTASLTVEGPEELVNRLVPDDVSIILNIAHGTRGTIRIRPEVIVPQGIDTFSLDVSSFEVNVLPKR